MMIHLLVVCLFGWLFRCLVVWFVSWLLVRLFGWLVGWLVWLFGWKLQNVGGRGGPCVSTLLMSLRSS